MKPTHLKSELTNVINVAKLHTIHYFEFDKNFVFNGETHDSWEMVYVDKGQVMVRCDDEDIKLSQGEIIFHRPNEFHAIRAHESSPNFFVISFICKSPAMKHFHKYHTTLKGPLKPFISSIIKESELTYIIPKNDVDMKGLTKRKAAPIGGEQLIKTYLEQLLIFMIRDITKGGEPIVFPSKESMESHIVKEIKNLIADRIGEALSVSAICDELGYSKSYLSRLFHEQTANTIGNYIAEQKINRSKELIRAGNMNFAQISDALSFDNPQYFSRVFRRIVGITPTEFKRTLER